MNSPNPAGPRPAAARRLLLYAHFDPDDVVQGYVLHSLASMRPLCSTIRFITSSQLPAAELAKLASHVDETLAVENVGFDFFMWKRGLRREDAEDHDEIVLMNSSVYGPFGDPSELFDAMSDRPCDVWGITENLELGRHLQSYFLVFRKSVLLSDAFRTFWGSVLPYRNKWQVIRSYEIGMSQWLEDSGFVLEAFCPWRQVVRYVAANPSGAFPLPRVFPGPVRLAWRAFSFVRKLFQQVKVNPVNPTVAFAEELLALGVPFLKLEVMRDNPFLRDLDAIRSRVGSFGYPTDNLLPPIPRPVLPAMMTRAAAVCPICGSAGTLLHAGKSDTLRGDGRPCWTIRKCGARDCGCAWLDPQPLESEIHKAYASYYTHAAGADRVRYVAPRYGPMGRLLLRCLNRSLDLLRLGKKRGEFWLHDLANPGGRLLEVGCGDGSRLVDLRSRGWLVEGQDVDPEAVRHARSKGLRIHEESIEEAGLAEGSFDIVLMSHVVEHLHDPVDVLRACRKLLKPDGRLVLSTPNIESLGHRLYGRNWFPLDPPRHLVIHSPRSLTRVLQQSDFEVTALRTVPLNCELTTMHSRDIKLLGWTDGDSVPRLGRELVPVALQLGAVLLHPIMLGSGEECFAVARVAGESRGPPDS